MHKHRIITIVMGMLLASLAAVVIGACGSSGSSPSSASSSPALAKAEQILGHAPTGLAKQIVDKGYFLVADDANFPPESVLQKNGTMVGFDVDVAKKVGALLSLDVKFTNPTWDSIPTGLQTGRFDVSIGGMDITAAREQHMDFTPPYFYTPSVVVTRVGTPALDTVASLAGKTIGTAAASSFSSWLEANTKANIKTYGSTETAMTDVVDKRLDGAMTAEPTAEQAIAAGQPLQVSGKSFFRENEGFAMKKGESDWLALLSYTVKTMHEDGSLTAMSKHWYNGLDLTVLGP